MDNNNTLIEALTAIKPFLSKVEDNSIAISSIDNRMVLLIEEVRKLSRIIYEGNGQPSLTSRVVTLETNLNLIKDLVDNHKVEVKELDVKLTSHMFTMDKASTELGMAVEEFQAQERNKEAAKKAKDIANYGWLLSVAQGVLLLVAGSVITALAPNIYSAIQGKGTLPNPPAVHSTPLGK